jgi:Holliday junction DNA helicase RuvA
MHMVDYFLGVITEIKNQEVVIDLGMVGVTVQVPNGQHFEKGPKTKIYCYMHWNAENGPSLFGFATTTDRTVFCTIIGCSGIGPKIALAILADLGANNFISAITTGDENILSKVNGIGKKKAEQIVVQLKHKVAQLIETGIVADAGQEISHFSDVLQALQSLNYSRPEINKAMDYLRKNSAIKDSSFDYLLRQALSYLSKQM